MVTDHKSITRVVIPLSPDKLAVGSMAQDWDQVVDIYNTAARESCATFYLSNYFEEVPKEYLSGLGGPTRARIANITSSAIREVAEEFLGDEPRLRTH